jgi:ABC-type multidrug transport system fused ATPase/permease subunit
VLLDEATASIDRETAATMLRVLREELKGSTVVTVAHRAEAVREADWVVVLDGGRVVDEGLPEDVLKRDGKGVADEEGEESG